MSAPAVDRTRSRSRESGDQGATTSDGRAGAAPPAERLDPRSMLHQIRAAHVSHVVTVPDTHQKSLLDLLADQPRPQLITVCTEDEAIGVNAGLYAGGQRPFVLIQNTGFYACLNTIRGIALDARVPTCMLIGEFFRDVSLRSRDNASRLVRMIEPTLELWAVPYLRLERAEDLHHIPEAYERCHRERGPIALLVGAPTMELA